MLSTICYYYKLVCLNKFNRQLNIIGLNETITLSPIALINWQQLSTYNNWIQTINYVLRQAYLIDKTGYIADDKWMSAKHTFGHRYVGT